MILLHNWWVFFGLVDVECFYCTDWDLVSGTYPYIQDSSPKIMVYNWLSLIFSYKIWCSIINPTILSFTTTSLHTTSSKCCLPINDPIDKRRKILHAHEGSKSGRACVHDSNSSGFRKIKKNVV